MAGKDLRGLPRRKLEPMLRDPKTVGLTQIEIDRMFSPDPQPVDKNKVGDFFANIFSAFQKFDFWLQNQNAAVRDLRAAVQDFNTAKTDHRAAVKAVLINDIDPIVAGHAVLNEIASSKQQCLIEPPVLGTSAIARGKKYFDSFCGGCPVRDKFGTIESPEKFGTGKGTEVMVPWSPVAELNLGGLKPGPGSKPDEALHHELVHAGRHMKGLWESLAPPFRVFTNSEEFLAVVITNIYMSEKARGRRTPLRRDHHGFKEMPFPEEFLDYTEFRELLEGLRVAQPDLWLSLAGIGPYEALFNPVRELDKGWASIKQSTDELRKSMEGIDVSKYAQPAR